MTLTPLITAAEGFPALERLVASAQDEVLLSFRIFDPTTRLREPRLTEMGLETWADLIAWLSRRDIKLRILLADFDPLFAKALHRKSWVSASGFADVVQGDSQILCAPHGQMAGRVWKALMSGRLRAAMRDLRQEDPTLLTPVQRRVLESGPVLRPVTVHQKFAIVDGRACIIGGLDINERRFDTPEHDRAPEQTWHDLSVQVEDRDFAGALRGHFAECWNAGIDCGTASLAQRAERMDTSVKPQSRADLRLVRTVSLPCHGLFRLAPESRTADHETTLIKLFSEARRYIYLETQFLRHAPLVDALCNAALITKDLQLIIVLPAAPERVLFGDDSGWDARHAHGLQMVALDKLKAAFGKRLAVVTPAQAEPAPEGSPSIEGAGPIYVHSKVTLIDDHIALIGSANLNGRSMRWDTEASVLIRNPAFTADLVQKLARNWLGEVKDDPRLAVTWNDTASRAAKSSVQERRALVLPYPTALGKRFAKRMKFLPDDMF